MACFHVYWIGYCPLKSIKQKKILFITVAGMDYEEYHTTLSFDACVPSLCRTVRVSDDCALENEETFLLSLAETNNLDPRVKIDRGIGLVTIRDRDSMHALKTRTFAIR